MNKFIKNEIKTRYLIIYWTMIFFKNSLITFPHYHCAKEMFLTSSIDFLPKIYVISGSSKILIESIIGSKFAEIFELSPR